MAGRTQAGAFKDNAVIPYGGVRGGQLNAMQRVGLRDLVATYVGWADDGFGSRFALDPKHRCSS